MSYYDFCIYASHPYLKVYKVSTQGSGSSSQEDLKNKGANILPVKALQKKHHITVEQLIHPYIYRFNRYDVESTLLFFYLSEENDVSDFASYTRVTDSFVMLEKYFYCIVYEGTDIERGIKAVHNIVNRYKREYRDSKFYMNIISIRKRKHREDLVAYLFDSLEQTVQKQKSNTVITAGTTD